MGAKKAYFGHPINYYNTKKESDLIEVIEDFFPGFEVENPNQKHHADGYVRYKEISIGMDYYFKEVLPFMDVGIFLPFKDGKLGKGVYTEAEFIYNNKKSIYEISEEGLIKPFVLNKNRQLSVEETRERVYPNYKKK